MFAYSSPFFFDFFFLLIGEALTAIIIGALYLNSSCEHEIAKWLIIFGSLCLALWFFEQCYVRSFYSNGVYNLGFVGLLALTTLAIGIFTSVMVFSLPIPPYEGCNETLHISGFVLMILFCVVAGLIVLQTLTSYHTHGYFLRRNDNAVVIV